MELKFEDLALTLKVEHLDTDLNNQDEILFLNVRGVLMDLLSNSATEIFHLGYAPDNTADGIDELLEDGVFFRIITYDKNVGVDLESDSNSILKGFH